MHETATDLAFTLLQRVCKDKDRSCMGTGPFEEILDHPLHCLINLPGRTLSPAVEMLAALMIINQVWEQVRTKNCYAQEHTLGHTTIREFIHFDRKGGVITCSYSSPHFELADMSLVAPALMQILLAHEHGCHVGPMVVRSTVLSRHKSMFEAEHTKRFDGPTPPYLTHDHIGWIGENKMFCEEGPALGYKERFFRKVIGPLARSQALADSDHEAALQSADQCAWAEWAAAQTNWLESGNA